MKKKGLIILLSSLGVVGVISSILLSITAVGVGAGLGAYFALLHHYKGKNVVNEWNNEMKFTKDDVVTIQKDKNKDFVILNLADVQMADLEDLFHQRIIKKEIDYLVESAKPDLITLTGDQVWSNENLLSLKALIRWLDSYKIPWAPVFGNHDSGNTYNSAVCSFQYSCDLYEGGKYSLFRRGPTNIGTLGNYAINIEEEGKIIKTLYMVDYGFENDILQSQVEYFNWLADGIKSINNDVYSSSMLFMHKPTREFYGYEPKNELIISLKDKGLTDAVCGHFHEYNETNEFFGINYTFACKTGELVYYYDDGDEYRNGGTTFTIKDGNVSTDNIHVDRNEFHIKGSNNICSD